MLIRALFLLVLMESGSPHFAHALSCLSLFKSVDNVETLSGFIGLTELAEEATRIASVHLASDPYSRSDALQFLRAAAAGDAYSVSEVSGGRPPDSSGMKLNHWRKALDLHLYARVMRALGAVVPIGERAEYIQRELLGRADSIDPRDLVTLLGDGDALNPAGGRFFRYEKEGSIVDVEEAQRFLAGNYFVRLPFQLEIDMEGRSRISSELLDYFQGRGGLARRILQSHKDRGEEAQYPETVNQSLSQILGRGEDTQAVMSVLSRMIENGTKVLPNRPKHRYQVLDVVVIGSREPWYALERGTHRDGLLSSIEERVFLTKALGREETERFSPEEATYFGAEDALTVMRVTRDSQTPFHRSVVKSERVALVVELEPVYDRAQ